MTPVRRILRTSGLLLAGACAALLFTACPTDSRRDASQYLHSVINLRLDPVPADHPYCFDADKRMGLGEQACRDAAKYRLRWERPEDTVGFVEARIYVDTVHGGQLWSNIRRDRAQAAFIFGGPSPLADSLIFILADSGTPAFEVVRGTTGLVPLDTTGRLDAEGQLVFGVTTTYRESSQDGIPVYAWAITTDRFAPYPLGPRYTPEAKALTVEWERPRDPTSFFEPGADSGIIRAYYLRVVRGGAYASSRPGGLSNVTLTYLAGGVDRSAEVVRDSFRQRGAPGLLFRLPDSLRVQNRNESTAADSLRVILGGFTAQDTLDVALWAVDTSGNINRNDSSVTKTILLTDTTQPVKPVLSLLSTGRNSFIYSFTASRDLVETGTGLAPSPQPNANIEEYRITRTLLGGTGSSARRDTVIIVTSALRDNLTFTDTARHLPPGSSYRVVIRAADSTGHLSEPDTLDVSTTAVTFPGADSAATCPPGFIAIPGGRFLFGDSTTAAGNDERPGVRRVAPSYCIEQTEHRNTDGTFATRVTWQQAYETCRDMATTSLTPSDSTWLCTEAEWERACEGAEPDVPLLYGMQAESRSAIETRYACNISTGDSLMAKTAALRDPTCISYDGVLDLSGNLSEWVLDPYTDAYPATPDTLRRGVPHTTPTATSRRGFRGSNYLNPNEPPGVLLSRARCSNRNFAAQSRPRPLAGCVSENGPQLVVTYNDANKPARCLPLPENIPAASIDTVIPAPDSSKLIILIRGVADRHMHTIPYDSNYAVPGLKPVSAGLTRQTIAIVTFQNALTSETIVDTLHATGLLNATPANQEAVFRREAAPPWSVVQSGGAYQITYRYAHIQTRSVPAKAYYSNAAMGFRCCSRPRP